MLWSIQDISAAIKPGNKDHTESSVNVIDPARAAYFGVTTAVIRFTRYKNFSQKKIEIFKLNFETDLCSRLGCREHIHKGSCNDLHGPS